MSVVHPFTFFSRSQPPPGIAKRLNFGNPLAKRMIHAWHFDDPRTEEGSTDASHQCIPDIGRSRIDENLDLDPSGPSLDMEFTPKSLADAGPLDSRLRQALRFTRLGSVLFPMRTTRTWFPPLEGSLILIASFQDYVTGSSRLLGTDDAFELQARRIDSSTFNLRADLFIGTGPLNDTALNFGQTYFVVVSWKKNGPNTDISFFIDGLADGTPSGASLDPTAALLAVGNRFPLAGLADRFLGTLYFLAVSDAVWDAEMARSWYRNPWQTLLPQRRFSVTTPVLDLPGDEIFLAPNFDRTAFRPLIGIDRIFSRPD